MTNEQREANAVLLGLSRWQRTRRFVCSNHGWGKYGEAVFMLENDRGDSWCDVCHPDGPKIRPKA